MNRIISDKQKQLEVLCKKYHVRSLEVFGSATTTLFTKGSDIDFLVDFNAKGIKNYADNYFGLLESLKQLFDCPIDLLVSSSLKNPYFLESIQKDRASLYAA